MTDGVAGLLRDKTRPSRIPPLGTAVEQHVVACTLSDPPGETTHWTAGAMAKATGISVSSVQRIWRKHGLQPHRTRQFKLSNDPQFAAKLHEIVGLYVDPPAHTVVLSIVLEQGVSKAGNPRLRTTMIQLAWLWLRHQPHSLLTLWSINASSSMVGAFGRC